MHPASRRLQAPVNSGTSPCEERYRTEILLVCELHAAMQVQNIAIVTRCLLTPCFGTGALAKLARAHPTIVFFVQRQRISPTSQSQIPRNRASKQYSSMSQTYPSGDPAWRRAMSTVVRQTCFSVRWLVPASSTGQPPVFDRHVNIDHRYRYIRLVGLGTVECSSVLRHAHSLILFNSRRCGAFHLI